jgi:beta-glucosidase
MLNKLTLKEKCSLLSGVTNWQTTPIKQFDIPSVYMSDGPAGIRKEMDIKTRAMAPSYPATCFPLTVTQASTWNKELILKLGKAIADEAINQDVDIVLGPGINIKRSPLGGRNFEYFSEDPYLTGSLASNFVQGVQSKGVGTSLKHFAINNQEHRRMTISSNVNKRVMNEIYLLAFEQVIKETQPWTVMCSYNKINGISASENYYLLTEKLRKEWGYKGLVISDWGAVTNRVEALKAGLDLQMPTTNGYHDRQVEEAIIKEELENHILDSSVSRILQLIEKIKENKKARTKEKYDYEKGHQLARKIATEGAVLLKNEEDILPIKDNQSIAVIGEMAKIPRYQGNGSSIINPKRLVSFIDYLDLKKRPYQYTPGVGNKYRHEINKAKQIAKNSDVVLIFIGLPEAYESEGFDRKDINLPKEHNQLVEEIHEVNSNIVVVLSIGSPVTMPWIDKAKAVLNMYLGGEAVGEATHDLIFGKVSPSGKLAETFPLTLKDNLIASHFPMGPRVVAYREGIYVGYRYYEKTDAKVLFPFGHGLSYTKFEYNNLKIIDKWNETQEIEVEITIKNVGQYEAQEVVQLYVKEIEPKIDREIKSLKEFAKVHLKIGEKKIVKFQLNSRVFSYYSQEYEDWIIGTKRFEILVGASSVDIRLKSEVVLSKIINLDGKTQLKNNDSFSEFLHEDNVEKINSDKYTKKNLDTNATIIDMEKTSISGFLIAKLFQTMAKKSLPRKMSKTTKKMIMATVKYSSLNQLINFTKGTITEKGVEGIIMIVKGKLIKGFNAMIEDIKKGRKVVEKNNIYPIIDE